MSTTLPTPGIAPSPLATGPADIPAASSPERLQAAAALALEVSKAVAQTVLEAFMTGGGPRNSDRYLLSLEWDRLTRTYSRAHVRIIEQNACIASIPRLAEMIMESNGMLTRNAELAALARACLRRIRSQTCGT
jgi:hypothetical protein